MLEVVRYSCSGCHLDLSADQSYCPSCGGTARHIDMHLSSEVRVFSSIGVVKRDFALKGKARRAVEFFQGWDWWRAGSEWVWKLQRVDRENNRYRKLVRRSNGEILRDLDEPLKAHQGCGDAKVKSAK